MPARFHLPSVSKLSSPRTQGVRAMESPWQTESFHLARQTAKPFLKWAGGKRRLVHKLLEHIGPMPEGSTYFEPFLGSGAVFFALAPSKAVLSDTNEALVVCYRLVRDRNRELAAYLSTLPRKPSRDQYYTIREQFNSLLAKRAGLTEEELLTLGSQFVWLNHTCFNGLYRVNRAGQFNVPIGSKTEPHVFDVGTLRAAARALVQSDADIVCADYSKVLTRAKQGDRVYLDPPYEPMDGEASFTDYTLSGFTAVDQRALASKVSDLVDRGVRVILSNSATPLIRSLYRRYEIHTITAPRTISGDPTSRKPVKEVIVVT